MSQIILDMSSGNTCRNDKAIVKQMIDAIKAIDTGKHSIVLKWQLSLDDGINVPLDHDVFEYAYKYGNELGYKTTSSVADLESLKFLLQYDPCLVKIPNDRKLDYLIGEVPRKIPVYVSVGSMSEGGLFLYRHPDYINQNRDIALYCVSQYPSIIEEYEGRFSKGSLKHGISDHTIGLDLFKKYQPQIWEKHFRLINSTGLDAGPFAITPDELREIL